MLEQSETSQLKLFLTDNGCAHLGAFKRLIVPVVLCLPSMLQYDMGLNELYSEKFYNA